MNKYNITYRLTENIVEVEDVVTDLSQEDFLRKKLAEIKEDEIVFLDRKNGFCVAFPVERLVSIHLTAPNGTKQR